ncbi:DinB family protein [Hamadaea tsunoensis]|uniref:DinB family protein n=1 Tax=Hamadaea tsunoensis TaxID=53368 RepID=UPI00041B792C|nr:DinB family protein [Hamadaea tsunoensis]
MTDETGRGTADATPDTTVDLLSTWLADLATAVRRRFTDLPDDAVAYRPDPGGNSVGLTLWHFTRWLDLLTQRAWRGLPVAGELWHSDGWAARTGYDPSGHGFQGFGVVTGYTAEEVAEVPFLPADQLLAYFEEVVRSLAKELGALAPDQLNEAAPGLGGERSRYSWLAPVLQGSFGHVGEIDALLAMRARAAV